MRKTLEGKGKTLEGERTLFRRGFSLPPNLPHSPRTSPESTRPYMAKSCFALHDAGALGGSFLSFWGGRDFFAGCGYRTRFEDGMRREKSGRGAPCGLRPCRVRNLSKMLRCRERPMCRSGLGERYLLTTMEYCTRVRHHFKSHPARKSGATAALCNRFIPPEITKTFPESTRPNKANQIFALHGRVRLGEVLGE